jgi:hypothetical protein
LPLLQDKEEGNWLQNEIFKLFAETTMSILQKYGMEHHLEVDY